MKRLQVYLIAALLLVAVAVAYSYLTANIPSRPPAGSAQSNAEIRIGGPFTLVDQTGKAVTNADFQGRFMLVYFGYTYCPDICPTSLHAMMSALDLLTPEQRKKIVPIFVSVDSERDTPAHLKDYVGTFGPTLVGLSGTADQISAVAKAYKVYFAKVPGEAGAPYTMDHSSITYVMDPDGKFATHFGHGATPEAMAERLRTLL